MELAKFSIQTPWTPDKENLLRNLWSTGFSASQCAEKIGGVTRNAVIGKAHRLKLERRGPSRMVTNMRKRANAIEAAAKQAGQKTAQEMQRKKVVSPVIASITVNPEVPASLRIALMDLQAGMCRWPEHDYRQGFCGHKTAPGTSWCPHHHVLAFDQKRRPR